MKVRSDEALTKSSNLLVVVSFSSEHPKSPESSSPSMPHNMYLPLPSLHHDCSRREWSAAHSSMPLAHRITTDKPSDSISAPNNCRSSARLPGTDTLPRPLFDYGNNIRKPKALSPPPEVATVLVSPAPRGRADQILPPQAAARQERDASSNSSNSASSRGSGFFCVCTPEEKIPRPSNCFMLYRKHHQATIAARNPRLRNPEISKILGKQWKNLAPEFKEQWQRYAEDEKDRHRQLYPEYKYKPNRAKRKGSVQASGGINMDRPPGPSLCSRCGGHTMNPPSATPFKPNLNDQKVPTIPIRDEEGKMGRADDSSSMDWQPTGGSHFIDGKGPLIPPSFGTAVGKPPLHGSPLPHMERLSLREPPQVERSTTPSGTAGLPPLKYFDAHLTLPPLKIGSQCNNAYKSVGGNDTPSFINKIKVLSNISPPLYSSRRKTGSTGGDGVVVAIEGLNQESVNCVLKYLQRSLPIPSEVEVRTFEGPELNLSLPPISPGGLRDATRNYMDIMAAWHKVSNRIMSFISESRGPEFACEVGYSESLAEKSSMSSPSVKSEESRINTPISSPFPDTGASQASSDQLSTHSTCRVALVPQYQLTTADAHASTAPISDSYTSTDHWEWMASLWRGCVGPNITIYVHDCDRAEIERYGGGNPVENRLRDGRTIIIRRLAGALGPIDQKALRRVKFEIEELLHE